MGRLGVEPLEERFLLASTASIDWPGVENPTNLAVVLGSASVSNALVSSNSATPAGTILAESSSTTTQTAHEDSEYSGTDSTSGDSEYTSPGTGTGGSNTPAGSNKSAAGEYNSTGAGTSTQYGTQTPSQDGQDGYEIKTPANSSSQQSQASQTNHSDADFPILQNPALIEGGATENPVNGHAIASAIPNAISLLSIATGPIASVLLSAGIVSTAPSSPNPQNADAAHSNSGGSHEIAYREAGQPTIQPQDGTDYFTLPEVLAIRIDPVIVNQTIDQLLAGLDAIIPDQVDQESLILRLGYWVVAVSATAVSCELVRQDIRTRQKARAEIRLLTTLAPQLH
jgi:hypothetical protein